MGKKTSGSQPAQPDPAATAAAQAAANEQTARTQARLNYVNQYAPQGSLTYAPLGQDWVEQELAKRRAAFQPTAPTTTREYVGYGAPGDLSPQYAERTTPGMTAFDEASARKELEAANPFRDRWEQRMTLSPEQQRLYDQEVGIDEKLNTLATSQTDRIGKVLGTPFDLSGTDAIEKRLMDLATSRLNPQLDRRREAERTRLLNQGLNPESEAYRTGMEQVTQGENDALNQLLLSGRGQAINELLTERNQPLNEIVALLRGGGGVQQPQFGPVNTPTLQGTDIIGPTYANYQGQLNAYNTKQQGANAAMGGLYGLGGSVLGGWARGGFPGLGLAAAAGSDRRLKEDIKRVGTLDSGLPVYTFRYKGGDGVTHMGVMADEVEKVQPEAVIEVDGYKAVYYDRLS